MLFPLLHKSLPVSIHVRGLLKDVQQTLSGMEESILIDRLLDTVLTRAKHAQKAVESAA